MSTFIDIKKTEANELNWYALQPVIALEFIFCFVFFFFFLFGKSPAYVHPIHVYFLSSCLLQFVFASLVLSLWPFICHFLLEIFIYFLHISLCASVTAECLDLSHFRILMNTFVYTFSYIELLDRCNQTIEWMSVRSCSVFTKRTSHHITSNHMMYTL